MMHLGPAPVRIAGAGAAFPADERETDALVRQLSPGLPTARQDALIAHVHQAIGVQHRAFVHQERAWTLAVEAARRALPAGLRVVAHLHASSTPSRWTGPDAARIGQALGLQAALVDLRGGCTGGLWALIEGARLAASLEDAGEGVLVTAADAFSLAFPPGERMAPLAMGDGAAALVLVRAQPGQGLERAVLGGAPQHADLATVPAELPGPGPFHLAGDPDRFAQAAEDALVAARSALFARSPLPGALHLVHGSLGVAERVAQGAPLWTATLARHGQLGAASLVAALGAAWAARTRGDLVLLSAGGGLGYGAAHWRLP